MTEPALHWSPIATAIGTLISSALGTGPRVYPNIRWTNDSGQFRSLFASVNLKTLNVWFVTREGGRNIRGGSPEGVQNQIAFGHVARRHSIQIEGFHAFRGDGSSEGVFNEQIDLICDVLSEQLTISNSTIFLFPPVFTKPVLEKFGTVLCHTSTITMDALVRTTATYVQG